VRSTGMTTIEYRAIRTAATVLAAGALLAGCGGGDDAATEAKPSRTAIGGQAEKQAPKGAAPTLKAIYRQFPKPHHPVGVKGAAAAVQAGEEACRGLTPTQAKNRFYSKAADDLLPDQKKMVGELENLAGNAAGDASFVAGQLAALVYEKSLAEEKLARYGYQGCIYQLARGFEQKLEKQGK
jgi:hypothetical protein